MIAGRLYHLQVDLIELKMIRDGLFQLFKSSDDEPMKEEAQNLYMWLNKMFPEITTE